jgi:hypothetical protein
MSRRRPIALALLALAATAAAACGSGSSADPGATTTSPLPTVGGVGALATTRPTQLPVVSAADTTPVTDAGPQDHPTSPPTTSSSSRPVVTDEARSIGRYVLEPGDGEPIDDPAVLMLGDSVLEAMTFGDPDDLDRYVAALGWKITVDARQGRHLDQGLREVEGLLSGVVKIPPAVSVSPRRGTPTTKPRRWEVPETVVIMLGNNYDGDPDGTTATLFRLLDVLGEARRIVLFTVPEWQPLQAEVNGIIEAAADHDGRVMVIDWKRITEEVPRTLRVDKLHPTALGASFLAQVIGQALGSAPGAPRHIEVPEPGTLTAGPLPSGVPPKIEIVDTRDGF